MASVEFGLVLRRDGSAPDRSPVCSWSSCHPGEIDISNAATLGSALDRDDPPEIGGPSPSNCALEFMDSSGIAMLLRAVGGAGSVEVRNPSPVVRRIIECTGLTEILRIDS